MDETKSEAKIKKLIQEFDQMVEPQYRQLGMYARQLRDGHRRLRHSVDSLAESLDHLRLCIKYQLFDLEATRRENKQLKKMLEDRDS